MYQHVPLNAAEELTWLQQPSAFVMMMMMMIAHNIKHFQLKVKNILACFALSPATFTLKSYARVSLETLGRFR